MAQTASSRRPAMKDCQNTTAPGESPPFTSAFENEGLPPQSAPRPSNMTSGSQRMLPPVAGVSRIFEPSLARSVQA